MPRLTNAKQFGYASFVMAKSMTRIGVRIIGWTTSTVYRSGGIFLSTTPLAPLGQAGWRAARPAGPYTGTPIHSACPFFVLASGKGPIFHLNIGSKIMNTRRLEVLEMALEGLISRLADLQRQNDEFRRSYGLPSATARKKSSAQPQLSLVKAKGGKTCTI